MNAARGSERKHEGRDPHVVSGDERLASKIENGDVEETDDRQCGPPGAPLPGVVGTAVSATGRRPEHRREIAPVFNDNLARWLRGRGLLTHPPVGENPD